jgi:3-mercaptopropionate dioxygenase
MTRLAYDLSTLSRDLDQIVSEERADLRALVGRARECLTRLLADISWLAPGYCEPAAQGSVQYLLHRHPGDLYTVTGVVFPVGYSTSVHDHTAWGLIGVWRGQEQEERFTRVDDGSRPGWAELRFVDSVRNSPGAVTHLIPPHEEIHRIRNLSPYPSCSIHVYGGNLDGKLRHQFDLETGQVSDFRTTVKVLD